MRNKFNIADLIIVIFLIAIITFFIQKFSHTSTLKSEGASSLDVTFTLKVNEIIDVTASAIPTSAELYDDEGVFLGNVISKKINNAEVVELKNDGQYVKTTIPDKYDVFLTVESRAVLKDEGYFLYGKKNIGAGSVIKVKATNIEFEAYVIEIVE